MTHSPEAAGAGVHAGPSAGLPGPPVPARALRASSPLPGASALHSACAAPSLAVSAAPSPAFVAVGKADGREGNQQGKLQSCGRD